MRSDFYDVIIVGGGVAASVAAYNLSFSKLKIACFEQGDFEKNSSNYKKKKLNFLNYRKLNINPNIRKSKYDYRINDEDSDISIANYNGVGGSSVLYSAHLPRFLPDDFKNKSLNGINSKWPLNYNSLKKFYAQNEKILGVAGLTGDTSYPDKINNLMPPVEFGPAVCKVASAFKKLGWHWWPSYSGVITKRIDSRKKKLVSRNILFGIIKPRYDEILEIIRDNVFDNIHTRVAIKSVVLTGGGSKVFGIKDVCKNIFNRQTRIGQSEDPKSFFYNKPEFSTILGMIELVKDQKIYNHIPNYSNNRFTQIADKVDNWIEESYA